MNTSQVSCNYLSRQNRNVWSTIFRFRTCHTVVTVYFEKEIIQRIIAITYISHEITRLIIESIVNIAVSVQILERSWEKIRGISQRKSYWLKPHPLSTQW